jgi:serine phosphatase RsbU (regulator of sigma subunit)
MNKSVLVFRKLFFNRLLLLMVKMIFILCLFPINKISAQKEDSLRKIITNTKLNDSVRLAASNDIINWNVYRNPALALKDANAFEKMSRKEKKIHWIVLTLWKKGIIYRELNDVKNSLNALFDALELCDRQPDKLLKAKINNTLGSVYYNMDKYEEAEKCFEISLEISISEKDELAIADAYYNLSAISKAKKNYQKALKLNRKYQAIVVKLKDKDGEAYGYANIASIYEMYNQNLDSSLFYYRKAMEIFEDYENTRSLSNILNNIGLVYLKQNKNSAAIEFCNNAYQMAQKSKLVNIKRTSCQCLSNAYENTGNYKEAYFYLDLYFQIRDSLINEENISENIKRETQLKYREKEIKDSVIRKKEKDEQKLREENEKQKHEKEVWQQKTYTYAGIGIAVLSLSVLFFVYRGLKQKKRANKLLEEKNELIRRQKKDVESQKIIIEEKHKEITDSINYAERLQRSLMASENLLRKQLNDYFVYFNPKEKVSGDFYWATELKNGNFLLACADSTGHGVPGAMMSIMNMNSLKESVKEGFVRPDEILIHTRNIIIETLANDGSEEGGKDGMDCSLLSFDFKNMKLQFALANNPVWIIRNQTCIEYTADKMPVGKHDKQSVPFTLHEIELHKGDIIYTFTDGFADQFGGPRGKKFKYANLQKLLLENSKLELETLNFILQTAFNEWKAWPNPEGGVHELEQVDDVCIIGIKI